MEANRKRDEWYEFEEIVRRKWKISALGRFVEQKLKIYKFERNWERVGNGSLVCVEKKWKIETWTG